MSEATAPTPPSPAATRAEPGAASRAAPAPLAGVRVLELARILAGPWAGQTLADLGADVVKLESPAGDDTRAWGPPFVEGEGGEHLGAAYFHSANRGKRSVTADFATPDGQALARRLALHADVVIENFKVGGLRKYGLDAETLRAERPSLVVCSITGFGQWGPYAPRAGYDFIVQGMAGAMSITGPNGEDAEPFKAGYASADIFTGLYAVAGILAALRRRDMTGGFEAGEGATLDLALFDAQAAVLGNVAMNHLVTGAPARRYGNAHPNIVPYAVFPASDGFVIIATGNDRQYRDCCRVVGRPDLAENPDYATNRDRVARRVALTAELEAATRRMTRAALLEGLERAGVPAGPINRVEEVFADRHAVARGLRVDLPAAGAAGGTVPTIRSPIVMDGVGLAAPRASPRLGADAEAVLADPAWGGTPGT